VDEFDLIRRFFGTRSTGPGVVTGIGDDGAVLDVTAGFQQVQVIDTLVEGVHFPPQTAPFDIGFRVVAVNLSDIAAMGARPRWMTLALTLANQGEDWVQEFARGLFAAADEHAVALVGGDTTSGDQAVATVHITGEVETGTALLRSGASAGEGIYVSGTVGDAAAGLQLLKAGERDDDLCERFLRPAARIALGDSLRGKASAAIDLSDGLAGDLRKLLDASGVGGTLDIERLPISAALVARFDSDAQRRFALTGGDDYELCFTARADDVANIGDITRIGVVTEGAGLVCRIAGDVGEVDDSGYRHFG
jgi:thiamine-monophosphate kinase